VDIVLHRRFKVRRDPFQGFRHPPRSLDDVKRIIVPKFGFFYTTLGIRCDITSGHGQNPAQFGQGKLRAARERSLDRALHWLLAIHGTSLDLFHHLI